MSNSSSVEPRVPFIFSSWGVGHSDGGQREVRVGRLDVGVSDGSETLASPEA